MYDLKKPCSNCPFKKTGAIELMPGRLSGIVAFLKRRDSNVFPCHKTSAAKDPGARQICYGSLVYAWKNGIKLPITARMAVSLGMLKMKDLERQRPDILSEEDMCRRSNETGSIKFRKASSSRTT